jgi:hypothetical protein
LIETIVMSDLFRMNVIPADNGAKGPILSTQARASEAPIRHGS